MKKNIFLSSILVFILPVLSYAATMSVAPNSYSVEEGTRLSVKVMVSSGTPINAVSGTISIPDNFSVESITKTSSVVDFWVKEPSYLSGDRTVVFEGVLLKNFQSGSGTVLNINLKAIKQGEGVVKFLTGTILANDGEGTDVTGTLSGANYIVKAQIAKPVETKPQPEPTIENEKQPAPTLAAPEIYLTEKYGEPAIFGDTNIPLSNTIITFTSEQGSKIYITKETDSKGEFLVTVPTSLRTGIYRVKALVVKSDGENSLNSNEIVVSYGDFYSDTPNAVKISILTLLLLLIYFISRSYLKPTPNKSLKKDVIKEATEAKTVLHKMLKNLSLDVEDVFSKGTTAEKRKIREIQGKIADAEEEIKKEIQDIEQL